MKYRPNGSVIASIAIHVVVAAAVLQVLVTPRNLDWVFASRAEVEPPTERIRYVIVPPPPSTEPSRGSVATARGPSRPRPVRPPAPLVAPVVVPEGIPAPPPAAAPPPVLPGIGVGNADDPAGRGGVALIPGGGDPRIWAAPPPYLPPNLSQAELLAQSLARGIKAANDSAAVAAAARRPGDWTVDRGGGKYGIDAERIYFGKYSVPSAILALLPIRGAQGNPNISERAERVTEMSSEIRARASLELDARDEIKRINARKDRERAARLRAAEEAKARARVSAPPGASGASSLPPPG